MAVRSEKRKRPLLFARKKKEKRKGKGEGASTSTEETPEKEGKKKKRVLFIVAALCRGGRKGKKGGRLENPQEKGVWMPAFLSQCEKGKGRKAIPFSGRGGEKERVPTTSFARPLWGRGGGGREGGLSRQVKEGIVRGLPFSGKGERGRGHGVLRSLKEMGKKRVEECTTLSSALGRGKGKKKGGEGEAIPKGQPGGKGKGCLALPPVPCSQRAWGEKRKKNPFTGPPREKRGGSRQFTNPLTA